MSVENAIVAEIKQLNARIKDLTKAAKSLGINLDDSGETIRPYSDMGDKEMVVAAIEFLDANDKAAGYTMNEIADAISVNRETLRDAVHRQGKDKELIQTNKPAKKYKRFRLKSHAVAEPTKDKPVAKAAPKKAKKRGVSKGQKLRPKGEILSKVEDYLKSHQFFTVPTMAEELGITRNYGDLLIQKIKHAWANTDVRHEDKNGRKTIVLKKSLIFEPTRETRVRVGTGVEEGRLKPPYPHSP